jgi:plastocyanin
MFRLFAIGSACLALALAAGCGDDDEGDTAAAPNTGAESSAPAETQASSETETEAAGESEEAEGDEIRIDMKGFKFTPADVKAKVGQKVEFYNEDDAPHNATSQSGPKLETKTFNKGGEEAVTLEEAGTIKYICTVHPNMTGTITVTE